LFGVFLLLVEQSCSQSWVAPVFVAVLIQLDAWAYRTDVMWVETRVRANSRSPNYCNGLLYVILAQCDESEDLGYLSRQSEGLEDSVRFVLRQERIIFFRQRVQGKLCPTVRPIRWVPAEFCPEVISVGA